MSPPMLRVSFTAFAALLLLTTTGWAQHDHSSHSASGKKVAANLPPAAGGKLVVKEPLFNAGAVEKGPLITHTFIIENPGTGILAIHAKPG